MDILIKCPNCGNPVSKLTNHKCEYCRTPLKFSGNVITSEYTNKNLHNFEVHDISISQYFDKSIEIVLSCFTNAIEGITDFYKDALICNFYESKKIYFKLLIPIELLEKNYTFSTIFSIILPEQLENYDFIIFDRIVKYAYEHNTPLNKYIKI